MKLEDRNSDFYVIGTVDTLCLTIILVVGYLFRHVTGTRFSKLSYINKY